VLEDEEAAFVRKGLEADFPGGEEEYRAWFLRTLGILGDPVRGRRRIAAAKETGERLEDGGYGYPRAFTVSPDGDTIARINRLARLRADVAASPVVLDPFAGGGAIPFEAARFGCAAIANELNPVPTAILHGTVSIPAAYEPEFAGVIERWGREWAERVETRLAQFFPLQPDDASIAAYIWAHSVPCPTTGRPTPLAPDYWLARGKAGRDIAVKLDVDRSSGGISYEVVEGKHASTFGTRSTFKNGVGQSIWTDETFNTDYIVDRAKDGQLGDMLLAICTTRRGKPGGTFERRAPRI
jgi:hypothetical protein